jgi:hypothetical protein
MELSEILNSISKKEDLIEFLAKLRKDYNQSPEDWENDNLERFLEAMEAWLTDMDGYFQNIGEPSPSTPSWKLIAQILLAARSYE